MKRWIRRVLIALVLVLLIAAGGFVAWAETPFGPEQAAQSAMRDTAAVDVQTDRWIVFMPSTAQPTTGFIFYPGARVDPRSYAPEAQAIADQGFLVAIVPMPLNLAIFGADRANEVIATYPSMRHWAIGGHSLGGAFAAMWAAQNADAIQGLVLWAAYAPAGSDLSRSNVAATVITASNDGLLNLQRLEEGRALLPADTRYVTIDGGNHAQFGDYGAQPGDRPASISAADQRQQVIDATLDVLRAISDTK